MHALLDNFTYIVFCARLNGTWRVWDISSWGPGPTVHPVGVAAGMHHVLEIVARQQLDSAGLTLVTTGR